MSKAEGRARMRAVCQDAGAGVRSLPPPLSGLGMG